MVTGLHILQPDCTASCFSGFAPLRNFVYSLLDRIQRAIRSIHSQVPEEAGPVFSFSWTGRAAPIYPSRPKFSTYYRDRGARRRPHRSVGRRALGGRLAGRAAEVRAAPEARPVGWFIRLPDAPPPQPCYEARLGAPDEGHALAATGCLQLPRGP